VSRGGAAEAGTSGVPVVGASVAAIDVESAGVGAVSVGAAGAEPISVARVPVGIGGGIEAVVLRVRGGGSPALATGLLAAAFAVGVDSGGALLGVFARTAGSLGAGAVLAVVARAVGPLGAVLVGALGADAVLAVVARAAGRLAGAFGAGAMLGVFARVVGAPTPGAVVAAVLAVVARAAGPLDAAGFDGSVDVFVGVSAGRAATGPDFVPTLPLGLSVARENAFIVGPVALPALLVSDIGESFAPPDGDGDAGADGAAAGRGSAGDGPAPGSVDVFDAGTGGAFVGGFGRSLIARTKTLASRPPAVGGVMTAAPLRVRARYGAGAWDVPCRAPARSYFASMPSTAAASMRTTPLASASAATRPGVTRCALRCADAAFAR